MKFENTEVWGFQHAIRGMRNSYESWEMSDSSFGVKVRGTGEPVGHKRVIRDFGNGFIESIPFNIVNGAFIIAGSFLIDSVKVNELVKIAVVMIVNSFCCQVANYLFVNVKHRLRIRLCRRLGVEPTERNIAVMESMEYQSV